MSNTNNISRVNQTDRDKDNYIPCQPPLEFGLENMMLDKDRAAENRKKILLAWQINNVLTYLKN